MADYGESSYRLDLKEPGALEQVVRTYAQPLIRYAYMGVGINEAISLMVTCIFWIMTCKW